MDRVPEKESLPSHSNVTDVRRVAFLNGACGVAGRIQVAGQVVDVPVFANDEGVWDPFISIHDSFKKRVRPIVDFQISTVRKPTIAIQLMELPPVAYHDKDESPPFSPFCGLDADLLEKNTPIYEFEEFTEEGNSFTSKPIPKDIKEGLYLARVRLNGTNSILQTLSDFRYAGQKESSALKTNIVIGYGAVRILPEDYGGYIITSDIDKTFLETDISGRQGLVETLFETAGMKKPYIGMPQFYRMLQKGTHAHAPLFFISASPHFFRRTLSVLFESHRIRVDGMRLKYLMGPLQDIFEKGMKMVLNFEETLQAGLKNSFQKAAKFLGSSLQTLFDQIAYKLIALLSNRVMHPTNAKEILLGDNSEADFFIFTLYQYICCNLIAGDELEEYLYKLTFKGRAAFTRDSAKEVRQIAEKLVEIHRPLNPVEKIWIHLADDLPDTEEMRLLNREKLPYIEDEKLESFHITPLIGCKGAFGFSLAALDAGLIRKEQCKEMVEIVRSASPEEKNRLTRDDLKLIAKSFPWSYYQYEDIEKELDL